MSEFDFTRVRSSERALQRLPPSADEIAQRKINKRLIVASAGAIDFIPEPVQKVIIQPNRYSDLALRNGQYDPAFALAEIVFLLHPFNRQI